MRDKIVLATGGSLGDVHPFIALALKLQALGFEPVLATAERYRAKIEAEGVRFHRVRPDFGDLERELGMSLPQIVHKMRTDPSAIVRDFVVPYLRQTYDDSLQALDGAALAVCNRMALGSRLAVESRRLAHVSIVLQPENFFSIHDPPKMPPVPFAASPSPIAASWNHALVGLIKLITAVSYGRALHEMRREVGLPRNPKSMVFDADATASATLGLYSPLLGKVERDFPPRSAVVGFPFYDSEHGGAPSLDPDLARFLAAGPPPLVFSLGTLTVHDPGDFYRESLDVARRLGMRAVLITTPRELDRLAADLSSDVFACTYIPHSLVFPRAAAIVHHGGIGTAAQALRAGKPQLVVPFMFDQPDNAHRLARLGVARTLTSKAYAAERAAREIRALLEDKDLAARAAAVAERVTGEDGAGAGARIVADLLR